MQAWLAGYYSNYRSVFDWMLRYLYFAELDSLKSAVERLDFDRALARAEAFLAAGGSERVRDLLKMSEQALKPAFDYDALLMIGLGHVNGTAIPAPSPAIYLGLEFSDLSDQLPMLVPHEFNHLVRFHELLHRDGDWHALDSFSERIIAEGLATVTPLVASGAPLTEDSLAAALMMPRAAFDYCEQHWPELWQSVRANWTSPTNQQLMAEYLMGTDSGWTDGRPARSGYYGPRSATGAPDPTRARAHRGNHNHSAPGATSPAPGERSKPHRRSFPASCARP